MPWPIIAAAGASLLGGILSNASAKKRAAEQMAFQERMSSTSYQRATEDMKMSGINPMLAFQQGGASSPGGAMPDTQDVIGPAVSSAMHAKRLGTELELMNQDIELRKRTFEDDVKAKREAARTAFWNSESAMKESEMLDDHKAILKNERESSALAMYRRRNEARPENSVLGKVTPWVDKVRDTIFPFLMLGKQGGPMGAPFGRGGSSIRGRY